jgi:hypothetical protein
MTVSRNNEEMEWFISSVAESSTSSSVSVFDKSVSSVVISLPSVLSAAGALISPDRIPSAMKNVVSQPFSEILRDTVTHSLSQRHSNPAKEP